MAVVDSCYMVEVCVDEEFLAIAALLLDIARFKARALKGW